MNFRCHHSGPEIFGLAPSKGWLPVEKKKSVKQDEREEGHKQEALDGGVVVLQDMIGVPALDQFVKTVIVSGKGLARYADIRPVSSPSP